MCDLISDVNLFASRVSAIGNKMQMM